MCSKSSLGIWKIEDNLATGNNNIGQDSRSSESRFALRSARGRHTYCSLSWVTSTLASLLEFSSLIAFLRMLMFSFSSILMVTLSLGRSWEETMKRRMGTLLFQVRFNKTLGLLFYCAPWQNVLDLPSSDQAKRLLPFACLLNKNFVCFTKTLYLDVSLQFV